MRKSLKHYYWATIHKHYNKLKTTFYNHFMRLANFVNHPSLLETLLSKSENGPRSQLSRESCSISFFFEEGKRYTQNEEHNVPVPHPL